MSTQAASVEQQQALDDKDKAIITILAKLALIYWRPNFTPAQARELYAAYVEDLRDYPITDIAAACEKYRRDPENKFYPAPGQLRGIIETVPSWDVVSKARHIAERRHAAQIEMRRMVDVIAAGPALPAPEAMKMLGGSNGQG